MSTQVKLSATIMPLNKERNLALCIEENDVAKYKFISHSIISDTSSFAYEFLLLDKSVILLNSAVSDILEKNISDSKDLYKAYLKLKSSDVYLTKRKWIVDNYDLCLDGNVSQRMLDGAIGCFDRNGVPKEKKTNLWRRHTSVKKFDNIVK